MIIRNAAAKAVFPPEKMGKVHLAASDRLFVGLNCFLPGQEHKAHTHSDQDKMYVVLEGEGEAAVGDQTEAVSAGDVVLAPAGVVHSLKNSSERNLVVLVVFSPPPKAG